MDCEDGAQEVGRTSVGCVRPRVPTGRNAGARDGLPA
jgi:hypothetical protein